jgi:flagellar hook-length control protein FliK
VEVTVASHEFEQNLDGNSSAGEQGKEASGQEMHQRRNLDLNNLDELSGLMSEEETLAAAIMRDNGGSVDYIA